MRTRGHQKGAGPDGGGRSENGRGSSSSSSSSSQTAAAAGEVAAAAAAAAAAAETAAQRRNEQTDTARRVVREYVPRRRPGTSRRGALETRRRPVTGMRMAQGRRKPNPDADGQKVSDRQD